VWVEKASPQDDTRMVVAVSAAELRAQAAGMVLLSLQVYRGADGTVRYCGVWRKTGREVSETPSPRTGIAEGDLPKLISEQAAPLIDLGVNDAPPPPSTKERAASALRGAEAALNSKPDDLNARFARASADFQLGESQKAIDDLNFLIEKIPQWAVTYQYRAIAHARLRHKDKALADLEKFQKGDFHREYPVLPGGHRSSGTG
jgi:hypothetical protein